VIPARRFRLRSASLLCAGLPALAGATVLRTVLASAPPAHEWPAYGGGPDAIRYSPLTQITRANVKMLEVAWTYDSGEDGGLQTNPIVVGGTLYTTTPRNRTVALDAATGAVRWTFDSGLKVRGPNRGVTYWRDGREARIFTAAEQYVYALDAATGKPIETFGRGGRIDLREGLGRPPEQQLVGLTTPGVIYRDLLIVGGRVSEGLPAAPGDIRAVDVRTGATRWTFRGRARHERRGQQLGRHVGRHGPRHRVRADRIRGGGLLWRQPPRRQPVREHAPGPRCRHGPAVVALPDRPPRHLGSRSAGAAGAGDGDP
jgi:glucose dehydrogenase